MYRSHMYLLVELWDVEATSGYHSVLCIAE